MKPYDDTRPKGEQIEEMFDTIAPAYDKLNDIMSLRAARVWRRKLVNIVKRDLREYDVRNRVRIRPEACGGFVSSRQGAGGDSGAMQQEADGKPIPHQELNGTPTPQPKIDGQPTSRYDILDLATGTGDMAILLSKRIPQARVTGADPSEGMLEIARKKTERRKLSERITFCKAAAENLPFADGSFDAVTAVFGVRNFHDIPAGLREAYRTLRKGGMLFVMEFSMPEDKIFGPLYRFYFRKVLPAIGGRISGDKKAYTYLPESVDEFPKWEAFTEMMWECGYANVKSKPLFGNAVRIYKGEKR